MDTRFIFFVLIWAVALAKDEPKTENKRGVRGKIVGGTAVRIEEAPYQVSIRKQGKGHFCGGSIIHARYILTAAHCVEDMRASELTILSGSTESSGGRDGTVTPVSTIYIHPSYNKRTVNNDIAILELPRPIYDGKAIKLARSEPSPGSWCLTTGYGVEHESSSKASKYLKYVWTPYVGRDSCKLVYSKLNVVTDKMICCGFEKGGKDACQGDSGGPMVVNGEQAGVTSWGKGCAAPGTPGVYTNVAKYIPWIEGIVTRSGTLSGPKTASPSNAVSYQQPSYQNVVPVYSTHNPFPVSNGAVVSFPTHIYSTSKIRPVFFGPF